MLPHNIFRNKIASEAILGQKHRHSSYLTRGSIAPNFYLSMYAFTKPADFEFSQEEVLKLAEQQVLGVTSLEDNCRASELAIYLRASFHCSGVNRLFARYTLVPQQRTRIL